MNGLIAAGLGDGDRMLETLRAGELAKALNSLVNVGAALETLSQALHDPRFDSGQVTQINAARINALKALERVMEQYVEPDFSPAP